MEADAGRGHCFELYDNKQFSWVSCSCLSTISTNKNITDACPLQGLLVDLRLSVKDSFRSEVNVSDIPIQRLLDRCAEIVKGMNKKPDDTDEGMNSALVWIWCESGRMLARFHTKIWFPTGPSATACTSTKPILSTFLSGSNPCRRPRRPAAMTLRMSL